MIITIDKWADQLANDFNRPTDLMFINRLKDLITQEYATIIKQSVEKNGFTPGLITSIVLPLVKLVNPPLEKSKKIILYKTLLGIKQPVRVANQNYSFTYFGSEDGTNSFILSSFEEMNFIHHLPFVSEAIRYIYEPPFAYVATNTPIQKVKISSIFSDITTFYEEQATSSSIFNSSFTATKVTRTNVELDIPLDLINLVKYKLINEELKLETTVITENTHVDNN